MASRRTSMKLWMGLGVVALMPLNGAPAAAQAAAPIPPPAATQGGEGGEGGEGGIDAARAGTDPVAFLIALDIMAAHYIAGRDIYRSGETAAAAEMFVHPIVEVYVEMESVFAAQGVPAFRDAMERASELALNKVPVAEIDAAAARVMAALEAADAQAPGVGASVEVRARVVADMIDRAALQYGAALRDPAALEPYLDGYGLYRAAATRADRTLPALEAAGKNEVASAIRGALTALATAYPQPARPAVAPMIDAGALLAASSRVKLALD